MKIRYKIMSALTALTAAAFAFTACDKNDVPPPDDGPSDPTEVSVTVKYDNITIKDTDVETYDYTYLFSIIADGQVVTVKPEYVDSSEVVAAEGNYHVVCTYYDESATANVHVKGTLYTVDVTQAEITVLTSKVASYDFKSLFTIKKDGEKQTIEDSMITSTVVAAAGTYMYTVTYGNASKSLIVHVIDDVIVVPSYSLKTLEESEVASYDFTQLFSLYVEGKAVQVTNAMIDKSAVTAASVGDTVTVKFSYTKDGDTYTSSVKVKIVEDLGYVISSKDIVIYPHSENIELESLFEIRRGNELIPVTSDMISGKVNYSQAGTYTITLNAFGQTVTATVTVEAGVVITPKSETVVILKGTNKEAYAFSNDFSLVINGVKYFAIPEEFFVGLDAVDFTTVGEYTVTLSIPYNTKGISLSGAVAFDYIECDVTYSVRDVIGVAYAVDPVVELIRGVDSYDVLQNVYATVNGRKMAFTTDRNGANVLYVYADVKSEPLDMNSTELQHVEIDVYVNGVDRQPIKVEYDVSIRDNVVVVAKDTSVFTGAALFTVDLFEVTKNGEPITVTSDMVSGKVDTFKPGVYSVKFELGGVSATASVTVFDRRLMGTYKTRLTAISSSSDDDDDDDDWGDSWYDDWYGYASAAPSRNAAVVEESAASSAILKDLIFSDDGTLKVNGYSATLLDGIDENTLKVRFANNDYMLYYSDGIIVLDPDNSVKLGFHEAKRPLVYFSDEVWQIKEAVTINYGSNHVLAGTTTNYSFDTFHIVKKDNSADMWYALYVELVSKTSADTIYDVKWGEVVYAEGFKPQNGISSSLVFDGETYKFNMQSATLGKIYTESTTSKYAGRNFTGTIDGKSARFEVGATSNYTLKIEGNTVFTFGMSDKSSTKNWYEDGDTDTIFIYSYDVFNYDYAQYSYKFILNTDNNTFTVEERDRYYGRYEQDGKIVYLDGYGTGELRPSATSYERFSFRYTVNGDILTVNYIRPKPTFRYGTSSEFYIGEFLNTLKVKRFTNNPFGSELLENSKIIDGAIVKLSKYRFGAATPSKTANRVKEEIRESIYIETKDGVVSAADKSAYVDLSKVSAQYSGYYQVAVTVSVGGTPVTSYYSIQIIKGEIESDNVFIGAYTGICSTNYALSIDDNGQIIFGASGAEYFGYVKADGDGLKFKAYSEQGGAIIGEITPIATNAVMLTVTGSINYTDYYVKSGMGSTRVAGVTGTVLREISISGVGKLYVLASSIASTGEIVTLTSLSSGSVENGSTVKVEKADGTVKYIKISKWGDTAEGITVLNNYVE